MQDVTIIMCVEEVLLIIMLYFYTYHSLCRKLYIFFSVDHVQTGRTPLMVASSNGHVEVVRTLIGSQAQLNTQDKV